MRNADAMVTVDKDWLLKKCRSGLSYIQELRENRINRMSKWEPRKKATKKWIMNVLYKEDQDCFCELISAVYDKNVKEITISFKEYRFLKSL